MQVNGNLRNQPCRKTGLISVNLSIVLFLFIKGGCRFIRLALYSVQALSLAPIPCNVIMWPPLFFFRSIRFGWTRKMEILIVSLWKTHGSVGPAMSSFFDQSREPYRPQEPTQAPLVDLFVGCDWSIEVIADQIKWAYNEWRPSLLEPVSNKYAFGAAWVSADWLYCAWAQLASRVAIWDRCCLTLHDI